MLPKGPYNANESEPNILQFWLSNQYFKPEYHPVKGLLTMEEMKNDERDTFCIVNPPPNAYMRPHIGNVSGYAYQDLFLRYNRMKGKKVLGQPGKDHAGIQGEVVVEKIFSKELGKSKKDMTREEFYDKSYEHFQKLMPMVMADEQRIGLSSDYDRNLFTLDPRVVDTVLGTFIKMYGDRMIYKGVRIINWDPVARTTLADIDTERQERESELVYIKYPIGQIDSRIIELKQKYQNQSVTFAYEREQTKDEKNSMPFAYGHLDEIEVMAIGYEEDVKQDGDRLTGVVVGIQLRLDKKYRLFIVKNSIVNEAELIKTALDKIFDFEKEYYAGAHIVLFSDQNNDNDYRNGVIVATTRAETMIGDTAVTVDPTDTRYSGYLDEFILLPLVDRKIPFITSPRIEKEFGTGAVKLTPAHAYDDFVMMTEWNEAQTQADHKIGYINIIDKSAHMVGPIPQKYLGMGVEECRKKIIDDLINEHLIVKREKHIQSVMIGERSKAVIEQIMSSQWFIDVEKLKGPAIEAVKSGKIHIHPENMVKKYVQWMENLRDWPVSRSLWWGYRIPVWYKGELVEKIDEQGQVIETIDGQIINGIYDAVEKGLALVQQENPGNGWIQDNDVFDTWFSSGQWPYATLHANNLIDTFFPSQVMETGYDILELWVSRMVMLSLYHESSIPFTDVYLHGLVKAADGQKMAKSKNNVIAPQDIIDKYGADSLRLLYIVGNKAGAGYPVSYEKLEGYKRFLNKIWNAAKFVEYNLAGLEVDLNSITSNTLTFSVEDNTMREHLNRLIVETTRRIDTFNIGIAAQELYESFWHTFADIYLEQVKPRLYTEDREGNLINNTPEAAASRLAGQWTLYHSFKIYLKLLHPFVPYITETIWQEYPKSSEESKTIMYAKWPK